MKSISKNIDKVPNCFNSVDDVTKQARKPRSYASPKLRLTDSLTHLLTGVKCRATSVAKKKSPPKVRK